jgi:hypothetical protein
VAAAARIDENLFFYCAQIAQAIEKVLIAFHFSGV